VSDRVVRKCMKAEGVVFSDRLCGYKSVLHPVRRREIAGGRRADIAYMHVQLSTQLPNANIGDTLFSLVI
jgi:hypothetical protein